MRRFFSILNLLLPVVVFVGSLKYVRALFEVGDVRTGLLIVLGALLVLTVWEGLLIRYMVLPAWGRAMGEKLYMGTYTPDDDPLVVLTARIRREKNCTLLPLLESVVRQDSARTRGWTELAAIYAEEFGDLPAALQCLKCGAEKVSGAEDRALLLYRAAQFCESRLAQPEQAAELYKDVAAKFPATVYGRRALAKINTK